MILLCYLCKRLLTRYGLRKTIDHVIPKSKGGEDVNDNRRLCCEECNQWKSDLLISEFYSVVQKHLTNNRNAKKGSYKRTDIQNILQSIEEIESRIEIIDKPKKIKRKFRV